MKFIKTPVITFGLLFMNYSMCSKSRIRNVGKVSFELNSLKERNVLPWKIEVIEGENVYVHMTKFPKEITECLVVLPDSERSITLSNLFQDDKLSFWSPEAKPNDCGFKIQNISKIDQGRYRLKAVGADEEIVQGVSEIFVSTLRDMPEQIILKENSHNVTVSLVDNNLAEYCDTQMQTDFEDLTKKCTINLDEVSKFYSGKWNTTAGIKGKIEEVQISIQTNVYGTSFSVGVKELHNNKSALFCNIVNSTKEEITFCRFIRPSDKVGFNLNDGIGNKDYRYHGKGIQYGECGIAIERPKSRDNGLWKCIVGLNNSETNTVDILKSFVQFPKQSIEKNNNLRDNKIAINDEVIVQVGNLLIIKCATNLRLNYCWFKHPNGTIFNPIPNMQKEADIFWFTPGKQLLAGECGLTIKHASYKDAGLWTCNMGPLDSTGLDITTITNVRISKTNLAAVNEYVDAKLRYPLTLKCTSVINKKSLDYCRFTTPDGLGFNIKKENSENNPIENLYYYNGTGLMNGDCQITIKNLEEKHIGKWTCTALNNKNVGTDMITVKLIEEGISVATISTIVAITVFVLFAVGFVVRYVTKKYDSYEPNASAGEDQDEVNEEIELGNLDPLEQRVEN